jgi:2-oxoglutarate ferredoxin oxidoreductase subunit alpha
VIVIEQNRDGQTRSLLMIELGANPEKLISVLNYDGMPITAARIIKEIKHHIGHVAISPNGKSKTVKTKEKK